MLIIVSNKGAIPALRDSNVVFGHLNCIQINCTSNDHGKRQNNHRRKRMQPERNTFPLFGRDDFDKKIYQQKQIKQDNKHEKIQEERQAVAGLLKLIGIFLPGISEQLDKRPLPENKQQKLKPVFLAYEETHYSGKYRSK